MDKAADLASGIELSSFSACPFFSLTWRFWYSCCEQPKEWIASEQTPFFTLYETLLEFTEYLVTVSEVEMSWDE